MPRYILAALTLLLMGCGGNDSTDSAQTNALDASTQVESPAGDTRTEGAAAAAETSSASTVSSEGSIGEPPGDSRESVTLVAKNWEEVQALIADARDKIVVVDLWSTACAPCVKEFPHLVELHRRYQDEGLVCISVSCDYDGLDPLDSYRDMVLEKLREFDATFSNVLLNVPSDEFYPAIDLASIPAVYVYNRDGSVARRFDNDLNEYGAEGFTYEEQIIPMVEQLLAEENES